MTTANISETMSILSLQGLLVERIGGNWVELEEETISLELGIVFGTLLLQKVRVLRALLSDSEENKIGHSCARRSGLILFSSCTAVTL